MSGPERSGREGMNRLRVLLFGANGFVGGQARTTLAADPRIASVTCPPRSRHDLVAGDLESLTGLVREVRPDVVVNCTGRLTGTGHDLVESNTLVTARLIEAVAAAAPGARLVRLGSASEYGIVAPGASVAEDHPCEPVSEYGTTHLAATRLLELASRDGRVDGVTLRVFNPIGAGLHADNLLGRAARLIHDALVHGEDEVTLGPLAAYRDFVDVRDVAAAVLAAVTAPEPGAGVVNVASGRAVTAREAVHRLAEAAGYPGAILERGTGPARSTGVDWIRADVGRARAVLGWAPTFELPESVKAVWTGLDATVGR
ncbi:NAD-dependent epimerase/dehydratase family protein [Dactylosporangium aurantiacum]|nr:NAD(P)-dependent oxidoreductase [Dactylosporangium aurantiacum]MDG6107986.1 NAD(P)-dependent oxidoreductase [Dactylosporangium aurantiacum]